MLNELSILKIFCNKELYEKYSSYVHGKILDHHIKVLLNDFADYFSKTNNNLTNFDEFYTWFSQVQHPSIPEATRIIYKEMISRLESLEVGIAEEVIKEYQKRHLVNTLDQHFKVGFNLEFIQESIDNYKKEVSNISQEEDDEDVVKYDINDLFRDLDRSRGLKWRLNFLNEAIGPLQRGHLIIVAAYTGTGKTCFAVSEAVYMAQQVTEGCVLWLNNEEKNETVLRKIWKSTLNCSDQQLQDNPEKATDAYIKRMNGDKDRIKFVDIRKKTLKGIMGLFEKYQPKLVVIDQADKIPSAGKAFSDHVMLRNTYAEIRTLANTYCPVIAISQADASTVYKSRKDDSEDYIYTLYPHHRQLDGSKVGKPGEADAIIMIGRRSENSNTRGLNVSKNKMNVEGLKQEVLFDGLRCRYNNPAGDSLSTTAEKIINKYSDAINALGDR